MKKILIIIFFLQIYFVDNASAAKSISASHSPDSVNGVERFHAILRIRPDSVLEVEERIHYNFGPGEWHGIVRDILIEYQAHDRAHKLRISDIAVTDEHGSMYPFITGILDKNFRMKIGDPEVSVTGEKTYIVRYTVYGALAFFSNYDELYWNVTGNGWKVPIATSTVSVILPKKINTGDIRRECFVGFFSDRQRCRNADVERNGEVADTVLFTHPTLALGEGLTVAVGFPEGIIERPGIFTSAIGAMRSYGKFAIAFLVCIGLMGFWYLRRRQLKTQSLVLYPVAANTSENSGGLHGNENS